MERDPRRESGNGPRRSRGVPFWFRLFALVLVGLVIAKALGLQVFLEVSYDGIPYLAALTDVRIYFVPLVLILLYILLVWLWRKLFGPGKRD